ncbi:MAG: hypothetical protein ACRDPT_08435 [Streptomycetales bacterium]
MGASANAAPTERLKRREHLQALAEAINDSVLFASIRRTPATGNYYLMVHNRRDHITEKILCDLAGTVWCYVWPWGNQISPVGSIPMAVAAVRKAFEVDL